MELLEWCGQVDVYRGHQAFVGRLGAMAMCGHAMWFAQSVIPECDEGTPRSGLETLGGGLSTKYNCSVQACEVSPRGVCSSGCCSFVAGSGAWAAQL